MIKQFMLVTALLVSATPALANPYNWPVVRVLDGDTVEFVPDNNVWRVPAEIAANPRIRVFGVDTPEKDGQCEKEKLAGQAATKFTTDKIQNAKSVQVYLLPKSNRGAVKAFDKFSNRFLGDIIIDGQSLSKMLIDNGHARAYQGDAKLSWCN
jgi:endonuclease YncB( thermonuclease family)